MADKVRYGWYLCTMMWAIRYSVKQSRSSSEIQPQNHQMLEAVLQHFKQTQDNFTKTVRSCSTFAFAEYNSVCLHCLKTLVIYWLFRANTVVSDKLLPFLRHLNRIEASDSLSSHLLRLSVSFAHLHCPKMCSYSTVKLEQ